MSAYPFKGLTKGQKRILDEIGCGNYSLAGIARAHGSIEKLRDVGLIQECGEKVVCRDRFGTVRVTEYEMPIDVHYQWCKWQAAQFDKEQPPHSQEEGR